MKRTYAILIGSEQHKGLMHSIELGIPFMLDKQKWEITDARRQGDFIHLMLEGETMRSMFSHEKKCSDLRL